MTAPVDNPYTRGLATFVAGLSYDSIPVPVRHRIKLLILDSLGCALHAADLPWNRILIETLQEIDSTQSCAVWGTAQKFSAPHAALANGTLIHGFELDDIHRVGMMHIGSVVLPALIPIAELRPGLTGRDFLTAAVAGYEVGPRVGRCMGQEHIAQGWHAASTLGTFSAGAAAAHALHLDTEQTVHVIGMAGTQSSGLLAARYGGMIKRLHAGRAAQSGLYAALLAARGFTGIRDVFEARYGGFCTTFSRSDDRFDLTQLTDGLGERFETLEVALKVYASVASTHPALDAVGAIRQRHSFDAEDVERVVIHSTPFSVEHVGWAYRPQGVTAAQLNMGFCIATMLLEGDCFIDQFTETKITDPKRMALAEKVSVVADDAIIALGPALRRAARVEVVLKDGSVYEETVQTARGGGDHFLGDEEILAKFRNLAGKTLPQRQIDQLAAAVMDLENLEDSSAIVKLMVPA